MNDHYTLPAILHRIRTGIATESDAERVEEAVGQLRYENAALREVLAAAVECWDGPKYKHFMAPRIDTARAILSKHYGTEGDQ